LACIWALWSCVNPANAGGQAYRRWAIVASEAVEDGGLPDLLTAELSKREDLEWVERQALQAIIAEQELAACFGAQAVAERIRLGKLVGADALVLLSLEEREKASLETRKPDSGKDGERETFLKLVITDCRCGARLWLEFVPYAVARLEPACRSCAAAVDHTRQQFSEGVRQVIAVTPFLSKNLVHDCDHLQAGQAYLLQSALIGYPGVAVVETEEARAIRRELQIAGEGLAERMVPLFVEGEYEVTVESPEVDPAVRLSLRVSDAKQARMEFRRERLPLSEIPELLRGPVAQRIVELSQQRVQTALTRNQQYALLAKRADLFSQFGAFEHSTGLREAALLLEPDDVDQRLAAIGDYLRWNLVRDRECGLLHLEWLDRARKGDGSERRHRQRYEEECEKTHVEHLRHLSIMGGHLECLLRRQALNPREADSLASAIIRRMRTGSAHIVAGRVEQLGNALEKFFWRTYPLFAGLSPDVAEGTIRASIRRACGGPSRKHGEEPFSPLRQYTEWADSAGKFLLFYCPNSDGQKALDNLFRFLTQVASPKIPLPALAANIIEAPPYDFPTKIAQGRFQADQVHLFFERLKRTGQPLNVFYGRLGLLSLKVNVFRDEEVGPEALEEIDALLKLVRDLDAGQPDYYQVVARYEYRFDRLRREILKRLGGVSQEKRHPLPENPIAQIDAARHVTFWPVEGIRPDWYGLRKCAESLDLAWTRGAVYVIPQKGLVRKVFSAAGPDKSREWNSGAVYLAVWDGESVWIACQYGIHVVSPTGEAVAHVGAAQGLPPYRTAGDTSGLIGGSGGRRSIALHAIAPGKCLAIGHFGKNHRTWCAVVSQTNRASGSPTFQVKVFHTATELAHAQLDAPYYDPNVVFAPGWLTEYTPPHVPHNRLLLVQRWIRGAAVTMRKQPLAINLNSLAVSVLPAALPRGSGYRAVGGHIVASHSKGIDLFSPSDSRPDQWVHTPLLHYKPHAKKPDLKRLILPHEGLLYQPGSQWFSVDPSTWKVERLENKVTPYVDPFQYYAISAHYGLVAWNRRGTLWRISIEPRPSPDADHSVLYPYVRPSARARHHQAVQAIRRLGGSVDTRWGYCRHTASSPHSIFVPPKPKILQWRTIVYLPETWKGGDDGLRHLESLYNLRDLYLVQADVTDEGLKVIGKLVGLESLYLVETKATDEGLIHLQGLDELVYLRLEGTAGGQQLGDAGLKQVRELPRLRKLTLYGKRFTDQGLAHLESLPQLRELWMLNTAITNSGLDQLKGQRRGLTCRAPDYWARFASALVPID
jgi:hypothetical protein